MPILSNNSFLYKRDQEQRQILMCRKCWRSHTVVVEDKGVGPLLLIFDKYIVYAKTADRRMLVVAQIQHEKAAKTKSMAQSAFFL